MPARSSPRIRFSNLQTTRSEGIIANNEASPHRTKIPMYRNSSIEGPNGKESLGIFSNLDSLDCNLTSSSRKDPSTALNDYDKRQSGLPKDQQKTFALVEDVIAENADEDVENETEVNAELEVDEPIPVTQLSEELDESGVDPLDTSHEEVEEKIDENTEEEQTDINQAVSVRKSDINLKEESLDILTPLKNLRHELKTSQRNIIEDKEDADASKTSLRLSKSLNDVDELEMTVEDILGKNKSQGRLVNVSMPASEVDCHETDVSIRYPLRRSKRLESLQQLTPISKIQRTSVLSKSINVTKTDILPDDGAINENSFVNSTPLPHKQSSAQNFESLCDYECSKTSFQVTKVDDDDNVKVNIVTSYLIHNFEN